MSDFGMTMPRLPLTPEAIRLIAWCLSAREGAPVHMRASTIEPMLTSTDAIAEAISTMAYISAVLTETAARSLTLAFDRRVTPDDLLMAILAASRDVEDSSSRDS
jgi:hypothetical protein